MAAKISTLVLTVDLCCAKCYKKIKKVLSKFDEIQSQSFDEKNNKVIISGPFDPEKLKKKLCCKACKYIKAIEIKKPDKPKTEPPKSTPPSPKTDPPKSTPPSRKPDPPPPPVQGVPLGPYCTYGPYWICGPRVCCRECNGGREDGICRRRGGGPRVCCRECYEGREDGICRRRGNESGGGQRVCCSKCYEGREDGICRRRGCESGGPRVCCSECYEGREDGICRRRGYESGCQFFIEEDPSSCIIM